MKMEQHTTTRPRSKPLGGRKFTDRHATADWCALGAFLTLLMDGYDGRG